jgi:uncharacterized damage-inducible protein DinB
MNTNKFLVNIIKINTKFVLNAFENANEKLLQKRISDNTNSMLFLLLHILDVRYYILNFIGLKIENPFGKELDNVNSIDEMKKYPESKEVKKAWVDVSKLLTAELSKIDEKKLKEKSAVEFPAVDKTVLGGISFLLQHESYHIGQLGLLRKYLELPPLKAK